MQRANPLTHLTTPALLQRAARLERALIEGSASPEEIDGFVAIQLELAKRQLTPIAVGDPRD